MDNEFILIEDKDNFSEIVYHKNDNTEIKINKPENELSIKEYILKDKIKLDNDKTNNSQNLVCRKNNIKDKPSYEIKPFKTQNNNNIFWDKIMNTLSNICLCCY